MDKRPSESFWMARGRPAAAPSLKQDLRVDVCVIGGGWAGLSAAYLLARAGRDVALLEAKALAGGESARSTAHLTCLPEERLHRIEALHGTDAARLYWQSHAAAIGRMERIIKEEGIACGFSRLNGYLLSGGGEERELEQELEACRRAGVSGLSLIERAPLAWDSGLCLKVARQAQLDPLRYLGGLAKAARKAGARLYGETRASGVEGGLPAFVSTEAGPVVRCESVIIATHTPFDDIVAFSARQSAWRSYVVAAKLARGAQVGGLYWDLEQHYVRQAAGYLLIGGEDHKVGQADDGERRYEALEAWARERFPIGRVAQRWSGQVQEPVDGLAFIGAQPNEEDNVYAVTGDSGEGTTHGMLAGLILTDLILGVPNPWSALYSPSRLSAASLPGLAVHNAGAALQYLGWLRGRGPVCPHLGARVCWNTAEGSWDCPAHGSRFAADGTLLHGPAAAPLTLEAGPRRSRRRPSRRRSARRKRVTRPS